MCRSTHLLKGFSVLHHLFLLPHFMFEGIHLGYFSSIPEKENTTGCFGGLVGVVTICMHLAIWSKII